MAQQFTDILNKDSEGSKTSAILESGAWTTPVKLSIPIPAGTNNIGDVDVVTEPATSADAATGLPAVIKVIGGYDGSTVRTLRTDPLGYVYVNIPSLPKIGTHGNAWNAAAVAAAGTSAAVDTGSAVHLSVFGNADAATDITLQWSEDNVNFYGTEKISLAAAGDFVMHLTSGAKYLRLSSSAAANITATIAGKA